MRYTLGLIHIATGHEGEDVYAIIHTDEGEILSQMTEKATGGNLRLMPFSIDGFDTIYEAVTMKGATVGFLIESETTPEELERFFLSCSQRGVNIAVEIDGMYMHPLTAMSLLEHPLYAVLQPRMYQFG